MTESDLQALVDGEIEESLILDYKAADALGKSDGKKKEITKDVSAMANSAGGQIIYGIKEFDADDRKHLPERIDPVKRTDFTREWLQQVINGIQPRLTDIEIESIAIEGRPDMVVYVVSIPQSHTAHQASDFRYYRRFNTLSVPMSDYEVRDVMSRRQHPLIELSFQIVVKKVTYRQNPLLSGIGIPNDKAEKVVTEASLHVIATNLGSQFAKYINGVVEIPEVLIRKEKKSIMESDPLPTDTYRSLTFRNTRRDVVDVVSTGISSHRKYGASWFDPLLPGLHRELLDVDLDYKAFSNYSGKSELRWAVYADNAPEQSGSMELSQIAIDDQRPEE